MKMIIVSIVIAIYFVNYAALDVKLNPLVVIEQGSIKGRNADDGEYSIFYGIPYAHVDENNPFGAPKPARRFKEVFYANDGLKKCPQANGYSLPQMQKREIHDDDKVLDCLKLNIFVPRKANSKNQVPVLLWIPGGGFASGGAGADGIPNVVKHNIVVVTINYRLGPYGFLCLNSSLAPGNQGLKDQYEAMLWVKKNIAAFGGNPNDITLGGQSAGGSSVLFHLYSNKEKIFNKVIAQSGVPQVEGIFVNGYAGAAIDLAIKIGFDTNSTEEALNFLSNAHHTQVTEVFNHSTFRLMPCKENKFMDVENFITSDPFSLSNIEKVRNTPILIGNTFNEIFAPLVEFYNESYLSNLFYNKLKRNFKFDEELLNDLAVIVKHFYVGDESICGLSANVLQKLEKFDADFDFNHAIQQTISNLQQEQGGPIYLYQFSYTENNKSNDAIHSAEMKYLFRPITNVSFDLSANAQDVSNRMTYLWANFIKYGNPTPKSTNISFIWKPIDAKTRIYLDINTKFQLKYRPFAERMAFWDLFYAAYEKLSIFKR